MSQRRWPGCRVEGSYVAEQPIITPRGALGGELYTRDVVHFHSILFGEALTITVSEKTKLQPVPVHDLLQIPCRASGGGTSEPPAQRSRLSHRGGRSPVGKNPTAWETCRVQGSQTGPGPEAEHLCWRKRCGERRGWAWASRDAHQIQAHYTPTLRSRALDVLRSRDRSPFLQAGRPRAVRGGGGGGAVFANSPPY